MTPRLTDDKVTLAPFGAEFLTERYVGWLNDADTVRFSEQRHRVHTPDSCAAYVGSITAAGHHLWAVSCVDGAGRNLGHVGNLSATIDRANAVAEMGIRIGEKSARGLGVGRRAWQMVADWLLSGGAMRKVCAGTMRANRPMMAVALGTGMEIEGVQSGHFLLDGIPTDLVLFGRHAMTDER